MARSTYHNAECAAAETFISILRKETKKLTFESGLNVLLNHGCGFSGRWGNGYGPVGFELAISEGIPRLVKLPHEAYLQAHARPGKLLWVRRERVTMLLQEERGSNFRPAGDNPFRHLEDVSPCSRSTRMKLDNWVHAMDSMGPLLLCRGYT